MVKPEDSLAAYAIRETRNNVLTIQAKFSTVEFFNKIIEIRAVEPFGLVTLPWWLVLLFLWLMLLLGLPIPFNVLGRVAPTQVKFGPNGVSDFVPFELHIPLWNVPLWKLRVVGIFHVKWQWQYRLTGGPWTDFDTSVHRIYTVLDVPKDPWKQQPYPDSQNPWTDILDYACSWASGRKTGDGAAGAITKKVNEGISLTYDMTSGGSVYTVGKFFEATKFIAYLETGAGLGPTVNCMDCATIVTTFSNAVGCDLHASRMGWYFDLTKIKAIGQTGWGCPDFGCGFKYHEVAWKEGGNDIDPLFDACLKVDGDDDPWATPHKDLLPRNIPFTTLPTNVTLPLSTPFTANSYRERLCKNNNNGILKCKAVGPWPGTNNGRRAVK